MCLKDFLNNIGNIINNILDFSAISLIKKY